MLLRICIVQLSCKYPTLLHRIFSWLLFRALTCSMLLIPFVHHLADLHDSISFQLSKVHRLEATKWSIYHFSPVPLGEIYISRHSLEYSVPLFLSFRHSKISINFHRFVSSLFLFEWPTKPSIIQMNVQESILQQTAMQMVSDRLLPLLIHLFTLTTLSKSSAWLFTYLFNARCGQRRLTCSCQPKITLNIQIEPLHS